MVSFHETAELLSNLVIGRAYRISGINVVTKNVNPKFILAGNFLM